MVEPEAMFELRQCNDPAKIISIPVVQELAKRIHNNNDDVPQRYIRKQAETAASVSVSVSGPLYNSAMLPIIDMSVISSQQDSNSRLKEIQKFITACQDWGFFQVINHGIPIEFVDKIRKTVKEFFDLPLEEKMQSKQAEDSQGYGQVLVESEEQTLDWADMMYLQVLPPEMQRHEVWPQKLYAFRETLMSYATEANKLGVRLMKLCEESLGLEPGTFVESCKDWVTRTRINYYPPCPRPHEVLGLSPHSDCSFLTILLQDGDTPGLQVKQNEEWYMVAPVAGALIVNIGDFMEVMTNGKFNSSEHRAVANKDNERMSIVMFFDTGSQKPIEPAPSLVRNMSPSIYRGISATDYINTYVSRRLQGKKGLFDYLTET